MTPEALAELHARCFTDAPPPWTAAAFAGLLGSTGCRLHSIDDGFLLARHAGSEAEILTIAVAPEKRRRGLARLLMERFESAAREDGAREAFLEVSERNAGAAALYAKRGFHIIARRPVYYADGSDALIMRKGLEG
ncbi:MAG: GNAT family N-acetyltransferase [Rubricella sp.]